MATFTQGDVLTGYSSGDMSSNQYKIVAFSTTNSDMGVTLVATRGSACHGIWVAGQSTAAEYGAVQVSGVAKVQAGDSTSMPSAITQGAVLVASTAGNAVPSTASGLHRIGFALESLAASTNTAVIRCLINVGITT